MDSKKPASLRLDFGGSDGRAFWKVFPPCPPTSSSALPAQVRRIGYTLTLEQSKRLLLQTHRSRDLAFRDWWQAHSGVLHPIVGQSILRFWPVAAPG